MYKMLMKFFRFCGEKNRKKFYRSVVLGVLEALCSSMKIAAAYFAIKAVHYEVFADAADRGRI